jgi:flagellar biogenesis protein FliO
MRVLGKLVLEPRRAIYMVEVGEHCFLVGVGDGPMATLGEVERPATLQPVRSVTPVAPVAPVTPVSPMSPVSMERAL